jgi:DNA polymerase II small subunit
MTLTLDQMVMLEIEDNNNNSKSTQGFTIKNLASPDIPDHLPNRSKAEYYAVLISDLHVGSKYFMETEFMRFLTWLSSSEDELVRKIRFLCIGGDLIDGIGIFPNQDKELLELNTSKQMAHAIDLLAKIPKHIKVFIIPGNHDPGRRSLPQPSLPRKDADKLYSFENFTMLGNPAFLELNGVKVLMYHGQSLDDIIATTPGLSYSKPAEAMKVLLKTRHLSPIYGQRTPIAPEQEDMMVIAEVPDVFHSGHVHVIDVKNYRGTLIVNSGTWQTQTKFQQTMGIVPTPGFAILINLATLQPFQMDFNH